MDGVFSLPVRLVVQQCLYRESGQREQTLDAARTQGQQQLQLYLQQNLKDGDIVVSADYAAKSGKDAITVTVMAECLEEIGEEVPVPWEEMVQIQSENRFREEATND